ncbi:MAG: hypothetical protein Q6362_003040 [Candidatus Wukongarchaeota archaeon]|nr:hypothetical protein [Candidatus Wukongarchaeota archaeon]
MKFTTEELVKMVEQSLRKIIEEERKQRWKQVMESDAFIKDVHETIIGINYDSFKVISEKQTKNNDTIIEFEAIQWLETEFTINEPYQFKRKGKLLITKDGKAELIEFIHSD